MKQPKKEKKKDKRNTFELFGAVRNKINIEINFIYPEKYKVDWLLLER